MTAERRRAAYLIDLQQDPEFIRATQEVNPAAVVDLVTAEMAALAVEIQATAIKAMTVAAEAENAARAATLDTPTTTTTAKAASATAATRFCLDCGRLDNEIDFCVHSDCEMRP